VTFSVALASAFDKIVGIDRRMLFPQNRPSSAPAMISVSAFLYQPFDYDISAPVDRQGLYSWS
jgi:hypothetical protein